MTYAEILIKKGKRGAAAFVQAECMSAKAGSGTSAAQSPDVLQTPVHLQVNFNIFYDKPLFFPPCEGPYGSSLAS